VVIVEDIYPVIGEVIWVWADDIRRVHDRQDNRWFHVNRGRYQVRDMEVPVSVHDSSGKVIGLMIPKVLASLNGIHAN